MANRIVHIINETDDFERDIRFCLHRLGDTDVTAGSFFQLDRVRIKSLQLLILNCRIVRQSDIKTLQILSQALPQAKILILAREIQLPAYAQIVTMKNILVLQKPCSHEDFTGVLNMLDNHQFGPAAFPRFTTCQPARLVVIKTGLLIPSTMKNYSPGGAFLEYKGISLKVGDRLQLSVVHEYFHPDEAIQMPGKVVWFSDGTDPKRPGRGVGIEFIKSAPSTLSL